MLGFRARNPPPPVVVCQVIARGVAVALLAFGLGFEGFRAWVLP